MQIVCCCFGKIFVRPINVFEIIRFSLQVRTLTHFGLFLLDLYAIELMFDFGLAMLFINVIMCLNVIRGFAVHNIDVNR